MLFRSRSTRSRAAEVSCLPKELKGCGSASLPPERDRDMHQTGRGRVREKQRERRRDKEKKGGRERETEIEGGTQRKKDR